MTHTVKNLTEAQIGRLQRKAIEAGDGALHAICDLALTGKFDADDWTALEPHDVRRVESMTRDDAYAAIVEELNGD